MEDLDQLYDLANPETRSGTGDVSPVAPAVTPQVTAPEPVATPDDLDSLWSAANPEPAPKAEPKPKPVVTPEVPEDPYAAKPDDKPVQGFAKSVLRTVLPYVDPYTDATDTAALLKHGVASLIQSAGSASEYLNQPLWGDVEAPDPTTTAAKIKDWGAGYAAAAAKDLSPATAKLLKTPLSETSGGNLIDALIVKSVDAVPSVVASLGGGAPALLLRGAGAATAGAISFAGSAGVGSVLTMGQTYQDIADGINQTPSDQLAANSQSYKENLANGMSEEQAKAKLIRDIGWSQPLLAAAVTGITSKFGIEEALASKAAGKVFGGIISGKLGPAITGMSGEALQEFLENASQELLEQDAALRVTNGNKAPTVDQYDWGKIGQSGAEGAAVGAVMGGAVSGSLHTKATPDKPAEEAPKTDEGDKTQSKPAAPEATPAGPNGPGQAGGQPGPGTGTGETAQPPATEVPAGTAPPPQTTPSPVDPVVEAAINSDQEDDALEEEDVVPTVEGAPAAAIPVEEDEVAQQLKLRAAARAAARPPVDATIQSALPNAGTPTAAPTKGADEIAQEAIDLANQARQASGAPPEQQVVEAPVIPAPAPVGEVPLPPPAEAAPAEPALASQPPAPAPELVPEPPPGPVASVGATVGEAPPAPAIAAVAPEAAITEAPVTPGVTPSLDDQFEAVAAVQPAEAVKAVSKKRSASKVEKPVSAPGQVGKEVSERAKVEEPVAPARAPEKKTSKKSKIEKPLPAPARGEKPVSEKPKLTVKAEAPKAKVAKETSKRRSVKPKAGKAVTAEEAGKVEHRTSMEVLGERNLAEPILRRDLHRSIIEDVEPEPKPISEEQEKQLKKMEEGTAAQQKVVRDFRRERSLAEAAHKKAQRAVKQALDEAFAATAAESQSSQHGQSASNAAKALGTQIEKHARDNLQRIMAEHEAAEETEAAETKVRQAEETFQAQERAAKEARRKELQGTGQERERFGKEKGKTVEAKRTETKGAFEDRHRAIVKRQGEAAPELSKRAVQLFDDLGMLKGGRGPRRERARAGLEAQIAALREEEYAADEAKLEPAMSPAEREAARTKALEEYKRKALLDAEEKAKAELEAKHPIDEAKEAAHREIFNAATAREEPTTKGMIPARQLAAYGAHLRAIYEDIRQKIGATYTEAGQKEPGPGMSRKKTIMENLLERARPYLRGEMSPGDQTELRVLLEEARVATDPREFFRLQQEEVKTARENELNDNDWDKSDWRGADWMPLETSEDVEAFFALEADLQHMMMAESTAEVTPTGIKTKHGEVHISPDRIASLKSHLAKAGKSLTERFHFGTQAEQIAETADRQIEENLGDIPVYSLTEAEMAAISPEGTEFAGLWIEPTQEQRAKGGKGAIVMAQDSKVPAAYTLRHEASHGLTVYAVDENINGARDIVQAMLDHLRKVKPEMFEQGHEEFQYGTTNPHEFIAEVYGNPFFAEELASIPLPSRISNRIAGGNRRVSFWDAVCSLVARILGIDHFGRQGETYAEAIIRMQDGTLGDYAAQRFHAAVAAHEEPTKAKKIRSAVMVRQPGEEAWNSPGHEVLMTPLTIFNSVRRTANAAADRADLPGWSTRWRRRLMKVRKNTQLATSVRDVLDRMGATSNPLEDANDAMREQDPWARSFQNRGDGIISRLSSLPEGRRNALNDIGTDATVWQVDPSNPKVGKGAGTNAHIQKTGPRHLLHRIALGRLNADFQALPAEDQALLQEIASFYRDAQKQLADETVDSVIASYRDQQQMPALPPGITDEQLRNWVVDGGIDRADKKDSLQKQIDNEPDPVKKATMQAQLNHDKTLAGALGDLAPILRAAKAIRSVKGFYTPLIRRGGFVVRARSKLPDDPNAFHTTDGRKMIFDGPDAQQNFEAWANKPGNEHTMHLAPRTDWVDGNGNKTKAPKNGKVTPGVAEKVITVTPHTDVYELYDSQADAEARRQVLLNDPFHYDVKRVDAKDRAAFLAGRTLPSAQQQIIDAATKHMTGQQAQNTRATMAGAFLQYNARTTMSQRRLRRSGVPGYSKSMARAMSDYNISLSHNIARLRARVKLQRAFKEADRIASDLGDPGKTPNNTTSDVLKFRDTLSRFKENIAAYDAFDPTATSNRWVNGVMTLSFIKNLWSPATWALNALQPVMVTLPKLAGRFGARAVRQFIRAYYDVGFGVKSIGIALKNFKRGTLGQTKASAAQRMVDLITDPQEKAMLLEHQRLGLIGANSGLEVTAQNIDHNVIEKGLSWIASLSSQMMEAIEANNRVVTALTTYRLARTARNKDGSFMYTHEQAIRQSLDVQDQTQGDYSGAVQPAFMQKKGFQAAFQFKKYPQMILDNFASVAKQMVKGKTRAEKVQAAKELAYLSGTHFAFAGAVGFTPLMEFAKVFYMIASAIGLSDDDWDDKENKFQAWLATFMGNRWSEALMRGIPRLLGIDLSSRLGLQNLLTFGSPDTYDAAGWKEWAWNNTTGAPTEAVTDFLSTIGKVVEGKYLDAAKALPIPKVLTNALDVIKQHVHGGIVKQTGRVVPGTEPTTMDSIYTILGFNPASRTRAWETGGDVYVKEREAKFTKQRQKQMGTWVNAETGAERKAAWDKIREWNKTVIQWNKDNPKEPPRKIITMEKLVQARNKARKADIKTLRERKRRQEEDEDQEAQ